MKEPQWVPQAVLLAVHERQLAEHGGAPGIRDAGLLESALARPVNLFAYGAPDLFDLAASYAYGLVANHPFIDGNKRVAFVAARLFLLANGITLTAAKDERVAMFVRLAAGDLPEDALAKWFRDNGAPDPEARTKPR